MNSNFFAALRYSFTALPIAAFGILLTIYLPQYLNSSITTNLSIVGYLLILPRLLNIVSEFFIGPALDRLQTKFSIKQIINLSLLPLILGLGLLIIKVPTAWLGFTVLLIALLIVLNSLSVITIAYQSLGVRLTKDLNPQILFSLREFCTIAGTLLAGVLPLLINSKISFTISTLVYFCLLMISLRLLPNLNATGPITKLNSLKTNLKDLSSNKDFVLLNLFFMLTAFGSTLSASTILIYTENFLGLSSGSIAVLVFFTTSILGLPFWTWLIPKVNLRTSLLLAILITWLSFSLVGLIARFEITQYLLLIFVSGLGLGGALIIPANLQAQIAINDNTKFNTHRTGNHFSIYALSKKIPAALGAGLAFPLLAYFDYDQNNLTESSLAALSLVYSIIPSIFYGLAFIIIWRLAPYHFKSQPYD